MAPAGKARFSIALADACSRDDGSGCWPSAATITHKATISERTVRRVITELETQGHLIVHRGGGALGRRHQQAGHSPGEAMPTQVALSLRALDGLTTQEIAHAFLAPEATMAQRVVPAKRKIKRSRPGLARQVSFSRGLRLADS